LKTVDMYENAGTRQPEPLHAGLDTLRTSGVLKQSAIMPYRIEFN